MQKLAFGFLLALAVGCGKPGRGDLLASFPSTASSPSAITAMAADDSGVYFFQVGVDHADIDRVSPDKTLTRLSAVDGDAEPQSLLLTADALIWPDGGTIKTLSKSGGAPQVLASPGGAVFGLIRDATNLYWISTDSVQQRTPASIRTMPIGGGPVVTLLSTTTTGLDSISVDEANLYFLETLPPAASPPSGSVRIAALPKNGGVGVTLLATDRGCCLQLANRRLFWRGGNIQPAVSTTDLDSRTTAVFATVGNVETFRLLADGAGVFGVTAECGNRNDSPRCWTWLRRLPSGEAIAYTEHFASAIAIDARYVYWTPGNNELWRVRR